MHRGLPPPVFDMTTKWRRRNGVPPWCARPGLVPLLKLGPRANAIRVSQIRNHTQTSGSEADRQCSQTEEPIGYEEDEIENDFQKKCRKGTKFAARTAFSAILGEISCLFSLALEFFTRFRCGLFLAGGPNRPARSCPNERRRRKFRVRFPWSRTSPLKRSTLGQNLY